MARALRAVAAAAGNFAPATRRDTQVPIEVFDRLLIERHRAGDSTAIDRIIDRYRGFVRMKASSFFLAGGEIEDLMQEGYIGLYKAVRDYRFNREASFRSFAELCVERQMITAIKTAARKKHRPLTDCVSFSQTRAGTSGEREVTLAEILPTDAALDPINQAISSEELSSLVGCLGAELSALEAGVLAMYLEGRTYEEMAERLGRDQKAVDNALQRVKRKITIHRSAREVTDLR